MGIVSLSEAINQARESGYDLAEIAPNAQPPVVKILDWGKYRYEQTKQHQKSRKHQRSVEVKQVRFGLKIGEHDLLVKVARARKFLGEGHKVKLSLMFRGREITHPELGRELLNRVMSHLEDIAAAEQAPSLSGKELSMIGQAHQDIRIGQITPAQGLPWAPIIR
jgi:translation initiation factor IF-3